jgi:hypothetical protein
LRLAVGDRPPHFRGDLLMESQRLVAIDLDADHGANNTSVIGVIVTAPPRQPASTPPPDLEALIEEARRRARRRWAIYGAIALVALAAAGGVGFFIGNGGGGPPSTRDGSGNGPSAGAPGPHGPGGPNANISFRPGPVRFLREVRLPRSEAPAAVRHAFAARRYSAAPPREAGRVHSPGGPSVLWASPAYGGGWCEGLQQPRLRFSRLSVSCIWPRSWMRRRIGLTGYMPRVFFGRVPQRSAYSLRLGLADGRSLPVSMRDGFFLSRVPDQVLAHTAPRVLVAFDERGLRVAREPIGPSAGVFPPAFFGGIQRPPGGAALAHKRQVVARNTPVGTASIWAAPSLAAPARCTWLQLGREVFGGGCRRYEPPRRGLSEVVPLRIRVKGQMLNLLWGQVGRDVARLNVLFQDGRTRALAHSEGVFLYPVPRSRWKAGHRPAFLEARNRQGRILGKRLLFEYTLAPS